MHGQGRMTATVAFLRPVSVPDAVVVELDDRHMDFLVMGVVAVVHPGDAGQQRQHEGDAHSCDAQLGAAVWHALPEREDKDERQRRQEGDQPDVAEQPTATLGYSERETGVGGQSGNEEVVHRVSPSTCRRW